MPCSSPFLDPVELLAGTGCPSLLDPCAHSFGCAGGPGHRGLGGCGCSGPLLCLDTALLAGNQTAGFLGGRGGLWQGGGLGGCLLPLAGSDRGTAVPSHGPPRQQGEVSEGGLRLHPLKVLSQGCLLSALLVSGQLLLQLLEEAWGDKAVDGAPGLAGRPLARRSLEEPLHRLMCCHP